ncbi:hypothetical protein SU45_07155 [Brachyspira hyodysenteriae]|nr:hypothetical protein SU45_07155 [Brachyspira hyodysenteriae]
MALKQKAKIMIIDYFHYYDTIHSIMSILATSNKQQATSNKQQATSNKHYYTNEFYTHCKKIFYQSKYTLYILWSNL